MRGRLTRSLVAALVLVGAAASAVAAHADLVSSSPAANEVLNAPPTQVVLTFTEAVDAVTASIDLLDDDGSPVPGVGTLTAEVAGTRLTLPLPSLPDGLYTVAYRVVSAVDGHIVEGSLVFLVDSSGTLPPPGTGPASGSPSSTPWVVAARWLGLLAGLLLLGTALAWLLTVRPGAAVPWAWLLGASLGALAALEGYLVLAAMPLSPGDWSAGFPLAAPFGDTPFAWAMRLALAGAVAATLLSGWGLARGHASTVTSAAVAIAIAGALSVAGSSLAGHASARGGLGGAVLDWLHLVAVAAWLGGLPYLARTGGPALRRHSRVALVAAPMVVLTGLANSPLVVGDARGLAATDYGNLLVAKALVFSVAVAIGAANFLRLRAGRMERAIRLVAAEAVVGALAVAVAATLVTGQPAAARPPELVRSPAGVAQLSGIGDGVAVRMSINLPSPGVQRYQVSLTDAVTGAFLTDVTALHATFDIGRPGPPTTVALTRSADPWLWGTTGDLTPALGLWTILLEAERDDGRTARVALEVQSVAARPPELVPAASTGIHVPPLLGWAWGLLPAGSAAWGLVAALLALLAGVAWVARRRAWARRLQVILASLLVGVGLLAGSRAAWSAATQPPASAQAQANPVVSTAASRDRGRSLYLANCAACHGQTGAGDGPAADGMLPAPGALADSVPSQTDGGLAYWITVGIAGSDMPPFADVLSPADRWDLVNYLRHAFPGS